MLPDEYPVEDWKVWDDIHNHPRETQTILPPNRCPGCDLYHATFGEYVGNPRLHFDPNKPDNKRRFLFATYVPDRDPEFKVHANRGHALNAMSNWLKNALLFEWNATTGMWDEIVRLDNFKKNPTCDNCGVQLEHTTTYNNGRTHTYNNGRIRWSKPPYKLSCRTLCDNCVR